MILIVLQVLYFFMPAYVANMAPVFVKNIRAFTTRLDFGLEIGKKPLFGKNKTWRGVIFGTTAAAITFTIQQVAHGAGFTTLSLVNYTQHSIFLGALIGLGALLGDAVESGFKRRLNYAPGQSWFPWDQIDFMIGAMLFTYSLWKAVWLQAVLAIIVIVVCNVVVQRIGYWTGFKDDPL